jgi:deoxyribonuclease-4
MIYLGAPQNTLRKPIEAQNGPAALELAKQNGILSEDIIVHAPYVVNLANPNPEKRAFSIDFLTKELIMVANLGLKYMVLHPGAHVGEGEKIGISYIIEGLNQILSDPRTKDTVILLETMAGKGTELGRNFYEIANIMNNVEQIDRVKVCFDTCHVNDAGYDLINNYEEVFNEFDEIVGLDNIKVIHLNDSKNIIGAHKDRHENLGFGNLGFDTLIKVVYDERFKNIPKILETPYVGDYAPYKKEIEMIRNKEFNPNLKEELQ